MSTSNPCFSLDVCYLDNIQSQNMQFRRMFETRYISELRSKKNAIAIGAIGIWY